MMTGDHTSSMVRLEAGGATPSCVIQCCLLEGEVEQHIGAKERIPRVAMAIAATVGASAAGSHWTRGAWLVLAGGLLSTVATGYCPLSAALERDTTEEPTWRTIKTWRVEAAPTTFPTT